MVCGGEPMAIGDGWPRSWTAPATGRYRVALRYENDLGTIETGVTAAVKFLVAHCGGDAVQRVPIVMPHSVGEQSSTYGVITAKAGAVCRFDMEQGFNMSGLRHFAHYTGGKGGSEGPLNEARIGDLLIMPTTGTP